MKAKGVVADAPGHSALLIGGRHPVGLTLDAVVHDAVASDGAVVDHEVPGPIQSEAHSNNTVVMLCKFGQNLYTGCMQCAL